MGVWRLPRFVGMGRAKQRMVSGQLIEARMAQAIGLVDDVVTEAELPAYVRGTAERYLRTPWTAVQLSKQMVNRAFDLPFDTFRQECFEAQSKAMQSVDHVAALAAYCQERARKHHGAP
jgi:enoyl-CoA hydratase